MSRQTLRCEYCLKNRRPSSFGSFGGPWCKFCDQEFTDNSIEEIFQGMALAGHGYMLASAGDDAGAKRVLKEIDDRAHRLLHQHAQEAYRRNRELLQS